MQCLPCHLGQLLVLFRQLLLAKIYYCFTLPLNTVMMRLAVWEWESRLCVQEKPAYGLRSSFYARCEISVMLICMLSPEYVKQDTRTTIFLTFHLQMLSNKFLGRAIIDYGITDTVNKFLRKLGYKYNHIWNVIRELDTYRNPICEYFC